MTQPGERPLERREAWVLAGLALLAFALRLVYALELRASPYFDAPVVDPAYHLDWARALAQGRTFEEGPFFRAPLYPWFLGALLRVFGTDALLAVRVVQAGLGAATAVLTYLVGRRAFDRRVALLAGLAAATYWVLIYFDGELLIPTLAVPLDLAGILLALRLADDPRPGRAVAAGAVWGLAALARPNVLLFVPCLALWLALAREAGARRRLRAAGALVLGTLAPILPVTLHNAIAGGDLVLISSQAGVNLWIGNNPEADGHTPHVPGTRSDFWGTYHDAAALAEQEEGRALRPSEVSAHYAGKALGFALAEPGRALGLALRKLGLFWRDDEIGNNQPVHFFAHHFSAVVRASPLGFGVLAPLGLVGLVLALRRRTFPLWGFVLVYTASVVAFFVCSRFRVPVLAPLCVLAAHAVVWIVDQLFDHRPNASLAALGAVFVGVALSTVTRPDPDLARAAGLAQLAVGYDLAGEPERAGPLYAEALRLVDDPVTRAHYADHLEHTGDPARARAQFDAALESAPLHPLVLDRALGFLLRQEAHAEILARAESVLEREPRLATVHYHRGAALLGLRRAVQAEEALAQAARLEPWGSRAQAALGQLLAQRGRPREALRWLEEAVANGRWENAATMEVFSTRALVRLCLQLGERERAVAHAERFAQRHPDSPAAPELLALVRGG